MSYTDSPIYEGKDYLVFMTPSSNYYYIKKAEGVYYCNVGTRIKDLETAIQKAEYLTVQEKKKFRVKGLHKGQYFIAIYNETQEVEEICELLNNKHELAYFLKESLRAAAWRLSIIEHGRSYRRELKGRNGVRIKGQTFQIYLIENSYKRKAKTNEKRPTQKIGL